MANSEGELTTKTVFNFVTKQKTKTTRDKFKILNAKQSTSFPENIH